jgi:hypothetical protein
MKHAADNVDHGELQEELDRLREAISLVANCVGTHIISQESGDKLVKLLAPPDEREEDNA